MQELDIEAFIIKARKITYASDGGKVEPALPGSSQLEYREGDWLYRDVFYTGTDKFDGIETVFFKDKPVFGMSYYGNWGNMTEEEIDNILRGALVANPTTRLYMEIEWEKDGFEYECDPDNIGGIHEIGGTETISKNGEQIYVFYYAGGVL